MNPVVHVPTRCPVCSSSRLRVKPFGYSFNGRWLGGFECRACGMIFIHPQPAPEELARLYSKEYFEGDFRCGHAGSYFDEKTQASLADDRLLRRIKALKPSGAFLEIGCAGGAFLHAARQAGYDVKGVEFSDVAAQFAREKFGLEVFTGDVAAAGFRDDAFDVVFMGDVLEHLPDPLGTCREVLRILKPGGIFVVECPTQTNTLFSRLGFFVYGMLGKKATVHLPPYHLFEYRPGSLTGMLRRAGFSIVRTSEGIIPPHEVTLRGSMLQKIGKKLFQYPNYLLTRIFGVMGDRIEVVAKKHEPSAIAVSPQ
ncbi:MAG TPA: class I SAM-dependent methyltransferase [Bacteroidota bacterium]|nr:class I SAM-dependent methyltransferase [Bacteroidota bacterium]